MTALSKLGDICRPKQWRTLSKGEMAVTGFPVYGANGKIGFADEYTHENPTILIGCRGSCGTVTITEPRSYANGNAMALDGLDEKRADIRYLFRFLSYRGFEDVTTGSSQPQIIGLNLRRIEIPLPPLEEQRRIAAILDKADALRAKRREAITMAERLAASFFEASLCEWSLQSAKELTLSDVTSVVTKGTTPTTLGLNFSSSGIPFLRVQNLNNSKVDLEDVLYVSEDVHSALDRSKIVPGDVLISIAGTIGRAAIVSDSVPEMNCNQAVAILRATERIEPLLLLHWLESEHAQKQIRAGKVTGTISNVSLGLLRGLELRLPPLDVQRTYVRKAKRIDALVGLHKRALDLAEASFVGIQQRCFSGGL